MAQISFLYKSFGDLVIIDKELLTTAQTPPTSISRKYNYQFLTTKLVFSL